MIMHVDFQIGKKTKIGSFKKHGIGGSTSQTQVGPKSRKFI